MNTVPAMKLISLLSRLAALGFATFILGLVLDTQALAFFAVTAGALILMVVATDYAPRTPYGRKNTGIVVDFPPVPARVAQLEKLAA